MKILRSLTLVSLCFILLQGYSYAVFQPYFQLPNQTGQSGKVLGTNGTSPSWVVSGGGGPTFAGTNNWTGTNNYGVVNTNRPSLINILGAPGSAGAIINIGADASQSCFGVTGNGLAINDTFNNGPYLLIDTNLGSVAMCAGLQTNSVGANYLNMRGNSILSIGTTGVDGGGVSWGTTGGGIAQLSSGGSGASPGSCGPWSLGLQAGPSNLCGGSSGSVIVTGLLYNSNGITSDTGVTVSRPWHPLTAPSCSIAPGGTTCTALFTTQNPDLFCSANVQGTAPPASPITGEVNVLPPPAPPIVGGYGFSVTYTLASVWTAGGTVTFNVTCD